MQLFDAIEKHRESVFQYGTLDCCLFVADVLREIHGVDHAAPWRSQYRSLTGALRLVRKHGGVQGIAAAAFGDMRPPLLARRGDPVLIGPPYVERDGIDAALGIFDGHGVIYLTDKGLARAPLSAIIGVWHV